MTLKNLLKNKYQFLPQELTSVLWGHAHVFLPRCTFEYSVLNVIQHKINQSWLSVKKAEVFPVCWCKLKLEIWFNWGKNNDKNNVFHFSSSGNTWRVCGTCCLFGLQLPRRWGSFDFFCCHSGKNFWANLCVTFRGNHGHFSQCCKWTNASENL